MSSTGAQFRGLEWAQDLFGLEPRWTLEPDETIIKEIAQTRANLEAVTVSFLAEGCYNKHYTIESCKEPLVMRVSLPVDPQYKTLSEVATLRWMRENTSIPVPRVVDFEASGDNSLGFEWILMTKMPGKPLEDSWAEMSFDSKVKLVKQIAEYQACLFRQQLRCIGNIYPNQLANSPPLKVGRIVSWEFFLGNRIRQEVHRGPFQTSYDWIKSQLLVLENESNEIISENADKSDVEDATEKLEAVKKLQGLIGDFFSSADGQEQELTFLFHDDLDSRNILVDDDGVLTGIVDWERVSAFPLWKACDLPLFMQCGMDDDYYQNMPDEKRYEHDADGKVSKLYWEDLEAYEFTLLRPIFLDEIGRLEPKWLETYKSSQRQRDFDQATNDCNNGLFRRVVLKWLEHVANGDSEKTLDSVWPPERLLKPK